MIRLRLWWERAFWVVPLLGVFAASSLSEITSELDELVFNEPDAQIVGEAAATTLLAAVGGAMVTFTGFVFSLVLLLLQFGSSQYSPRTVAFFLRARSTQVILGIFLATALFCFLTLLGVGSLGRDDFSPSASVLVATLLLLTSLVAFIVLMHLVSKRIRIDAVVSSLGSQTRRRVRRAEARMRRHSRFPVVAAAAGPTPVSDQVSPATADEPTRQPPRDERHLVRYEGRSGHVVAIDWLRLRRTARRQQADVELLVRVGDALAPGRPIAWSSGQPREGRALSRCFVVDGERSLRFDPTYGLRILVDIALKGLSNRLDDPTTAVRALDEIDGVLRVAARLPLEPLQLSDTPRVTVPVPTWPDVVNLAVREIRLAGLHQPQVTRRLVALLTGLAADLPPERAQCLQEHLAALRTQVTAALPAEEAAFALDPDYQGIGGTRPAAAARA